MKIGIYCHVEGSPPCGVLCLPHSFMEKEGGSRPFPPGELHLQRMKKRSLLWSCNFNPGKAHSYNHVSPGQPTLSLPVNFRHAANGPLGLNWFLSCPQDACDFKQLCNQVKSWFRLSSMQDVKQQSALGSVSMRHDWHRLQHVSCAKITAARSSQYFVVTAKNRSNSYPLSHFFK